MQVNVPADLEALIEKRMSSGAYNSIEEVLRSALLAQDEQETLSACEHDAVRAHIEERYLASEQHPPLSSAEAFAKIDASKEVWRKHRSGSE